MPTGRYPEWVADAMAWTGADFSSIGDYVFGGHRAAARNPRRTAAAVANNFACVTLARSSSTATIRRELGAS
jgi:hypothetical protein